MKPYCFYNGQKQRIFSFENPTAIIKGAARRPIKCYFKIFVLILFVQVQEKQQYPFEDLFVPWHWSEQSPGGQWANTVSPEQYPIAMKGLKHSSPAIGL